MVIDMLRLPGVLAPEGLSQASERHWREGGPCVSPGPERPRTTPAVSTRKGNCNARYVDLTPSPSAAANQIAAAAPTRRPARAQDAGRPRDAHRVVTRGAT